jgi:hypothetical protein
MKQVAGYQRLRIGSNNYLRKRRRHSREKCLKMAAKLACPVALLGGAWAYLES